MGKRVLFDIRNSMSKKIYMYSFELSNKFLRGLLTIVQAIELSNSYLSQILYQKNFFINRNNSNTLRSNFHS